MKENWQQALSGFITLFCIILGVGLLAVMGWGAYSLIRYLISLI